MTDQAVQADIIIGLNTKQATAELRRLQSQITQFNKSVITTNTAAAAAQKSYNDRLVQQVGAVKGFTTHITNAADATNRLSTSIERNRLTMGQYFKYAAASSQTFGRLFQRQHNEVMELATERVKRLQTQYIALGQAQDGVARSLAVRPMQLYNAQSAIGIQRQQIFNKLLRDGSTALVNWGKNIQWAGRQLMVGISLPLTAFGVVAGKIFADLEKQIVNFKRVYGDLGTTQAETNVMVGQVQALAKEYTKFGIAVDDTVGLAAKAAAMGAQGKDLIAATSEATRLATLGQIDQNQALTATIALQSAFNIQSKDLASTVDFLNAVENQTVVSLDDITQAIPRVAPIIRGLGGDVKDLSVFLAAMREGGVNAAEGANALKSGLASLINPTKSAREQLAKMGIDIDAIIKNNKGDLMGMVQSFAASLEHLDKFSRQQTLSKVFGKYQFARMGALFANINKEGSQAQRVMDLTGESAKNLAKISERELGAIENAVSVKFTAAVEKLKLAIAPIGSLFMKAVTPLVDLVTKLAEKFNSLPDGLKTFITWGAIIGGVVVPVMVMMVGLFGNFVGQIIKMADGFRRVMAFISGNGKAFDYLTNEELDAIAATSSLEGATNSLTASLDVQRQSVYDLATAYEKMAIIAQETVASLPQGFRKPTAVRMATGGTVPGVGNKDTTPALLTPGEKVVNKAASRRFGPIIDAMNSGRIKMFAKGTPAKAYGEYAVRMQDGSENMARKASSVSFADVMSMLSLRIGEGRGIVPNQANLEAEAFDPIVKEYRAIVTKFVNNVNGHFNTTFASIEDTDERFAQAWRKTGKEMETEINKIPLKTDRIVMRRFAALDDDIYNTIPTRANKKGVLDSQRKRAFKDSKYGVKSYTDIRGTGRLMWSRLMDGADSSHLQVGHALTEGKTKLVDLEELLKDPERSSYVKDAIKSAKGVGKKTSKAAVEGLKEGQKAASPSRDTAREGDNFVDGYVNEINAGRPRAEEAGAGLGNSARTGLLGPKGRRKVRKNGQAQMAVQSRRIQNVDLAWAMANAEDEKFNQKRAAQQKMNDLHEEALKENIARTEEQTASIERATKANLEEADEAAKRVNPAKRFGRALLEGSGKLQAGLFAMDGMVVAASFMNNKIGEMANAIMPFVFGLQGITMMLPMLANPYVLAVSAVAAVGAGLFLLNKQVSDMIQKARDMSDALYGSTAAVNGVADFFDKKTWSQKLVEDRQNRSSGVALSQREMNKADEYVASDAGQSLVENIRGLLDQVGPAAASTAIKNNVSRMVLSGAISAKMGIAIADSIARALGNEALSISATSTITDVVGPDGKKLNKNRLDLVANITGDMANLDDAFARAGLQWDGASWWTQVTMILKGEGTDTLTSAAGSQEAVDRLNVFQQEIDRLQQQLESGAISAKNYKKQMDALFEVRKDASYEAQVKQMVKTLGDTWSDHAKDVFNQGFWDGLEKSLQGSQGEKIASSFRDNLKNTIFSESNGFKHSVDLTDPEAVREKIAALNDTGRESAKKLAQEIQDKFNAVMNLSINVQSGAIDANTITKMINEGKSSVDIVATLSAKFDDPQSQALYTMAANNMNPGAYGSNGRKTMFEVTVGFLDQGKNDQAAELIDMALQGKRLGIEIDAVFNQKGKRAAKETLADISAFKKLKSPITRKMVVEYIPQGYELTKDQMDAFMSLPDEKKKTFYSYYRTIIMEPETQQAAGYSYVNDPANKKKFPMGAYGMSPEQIQQFGLQQLTDQMLGGLNTGGNGGGDKPDVPGGGGGGGDKTWLQKYIADVNANLKLFSTADGVSKNYLAKKGSFFGLLRKLTAEGAPRDLIEAIGTGADGLKNLNAVLKMNATERQKLYDNVRKITAAQSMDSMIKRFNDNRNKERVRKIALSDPTVTKEEAEKIASDADMVNSIILSVGKARAEALRKAIQIVRQEEGPIDPLQVKEDLFNAYENVQNINRQLDELNQLKPLQDQLDVLNDQNDLYSRQIELKERELEPIQKQIDLLGEEKDKINDLYDTRIAALDEMDKINERIAKTQQTQLTLAQALSVGDVAAAARAAQDLQQQLAEDRQQDARDSLENARQAQLAAIDALITAEENKQKAIQDQIATIQDKQRANQDAQYAMQQKINAKTKELDSIYDNQIEKVAHLQNQLAQAAKTLIELQQKAAPYGITATGTQSQVNGTATTPTTVISAGADQTLMPNGRDKLSDKIADGTVVYKNGKYFFTRTGKEVKWFTGGYVKRYAGGGGVVGIDSVSASLTPGEYVMRKASVQKYGVGMLSRMNMGSYEVPTAQNTTVKNAAPGAGNMYNYEINVTVTGTNLDANDVANAVYGKIKSVEDRNIRSIKIG